MKKLTEKQYLVLCFLQQYLAERQQAPLIREIQSSCQITSYKSTVDRLNSLERKGWIKRSPNKHRGIQLVRIAESSDVSMPSVAAT